EILPFAGRTVEEVEQRGGAPQVGDEVEEGDHRKGQGVEGELPNRHEVDEQRAGGDPQELGESLRGKIGREDFPPAHEPARWDGDRLRSWNRLHRLQRASTPSSSST